MTAHMLRRTFQVYQHHGSRALFLCGYHVAALAAVSIPTGGTTLSKHGLGRMRRGQGLAWQCGAALTLQVAHGAASSHACKQSLGLWKLRGGCTHWEMLSSHPNVDCTPAFAAALRGENLVLNCAITCTKHSECCQAQAGVHNRHCTQVHIKQSSAIYAHCIYLSSVACSEALRLLLLTAPAHLGLCLTLSPQCLAPDLRHPQQPLLVPQCVRGRKAG